MRLQTYLARGQGESYVTASRQQKRAKNRQISNYNSLLITHPIASHFFCLSMGR